MTLASLVDALRRVGSTDFLHEPAHSIADELEEDGSCFVFVARPLPAAQVLDIEHRFNMLVARGHEVTGSDHTVRSLRNVIRDIAVASASSPSNTILVFTADDHVVGCVQFSR